VTFAKLGYTYILGPGLDRVREKLIDPRLTTLKTLRAYCHEPRASEHAILVADKPVPCLAVKIGSSISYLPNVGEDGSLYEQLAELRIQSNQATWHFTGVIPWPDRFEAALDSSIVRDEAR
jgi:hypothetical protein